MPKKKKSKAQGLSPQQIQQMNRDNINYQMRVMPPLKFDDMLNNSNKMMGGLMGNAIPLLQGMIDMGNSQMGSNPMMQMFGGYQQQPPTPNLMDILAQLQPPEPEPPAQPAQPAQPQVPGVPNLTPEQLAAIRRFHGYGGRVM
jgi:hypothetical protein